MTKDELIKELGNLAIRFSEGWHEGIKIDASDIMLFNQIAEALAQPEPWEKFCDSNCVWTDHHPDCKLAERLPLPAFTTGHCKEKAKEGGCQLHNIQCGFPACDRKES